MTDNEFISRITEKVAEIQKCVSRVMPVKAGRMAKEHFQENFLLGGFVDGGLEKWTPAKRLGGTVEDEDGNVKHIPPAKGAKGKYKTLMSSRNNMYDSIEYTVSDAEVVIEDDVEYAAVHNEGLHAGRGKGFTMPKRQFIGKSEELDEAINEMIEKELTKILEL